jgi:hypothetical protein
MADSNYQGSFTNPYAAMEGGISPVAPTPTPKMARKRIIELQTLAVEAVAWAESKGLKRGEQCMFREMCERIWWAD